MHIRLATNNMLPSHLNTSSRQSQTKLYGAKQMVGPSMCIEPRLAQFGWLDFFDKRNFAQSSLQGDATIVCANPASAYPIHPKS